jgi:hypothetical protein
MANGAPEGRKRGGDGGILVSCEALWLGMGASHRLARLIIDGEGSESFEHVLLDQRGAADVLADHLAKRKFRSAEPTAGGRLLPGFGCSRH